MKDCNHYYELQTTQTQYYSINVGTGGVHEVAYLLCRKCGSVKKTRVEDSNKSDTE